MQFLWNSKVCFCSFPNRTSRGRQMRQQLAALREARSGEGPQSEEAQAPRCPWGPWERQVCVLCPASPQARCLMARGHHRSRHLLPLCFERLISSSII